MARLNEADEWGPGEEAALRAAWVSEPPRLTGPVVIADYDPAWPALFEREEGRLRDVLGAEILLLEHVGSTSVPGLAAKPIIDIDLSIEDTADESGYLPALERLGYRLVLREPWWHGHRMLVSAAEDVHLHVWPRDAPEPIRHRLFRDWLRSHPEDLELYATTKRRLARDTAPQPGEYSLAKNDVIDAIYARIFSQPAE